MRFYFHPQADKELSEAVQYYEDRQVGLGLEFAKEVYATIGRIAAYPNACLVLSQNTRRCLMSRFPYSVVYQVKSQMLYIIAVANLHRLPGYWDNRT